MNPFKKYKFLSLLNAPNEEPQLDYEGQLLYGVGSQVYILVAIDRHPKYPSAMLTKTPRANKIIKLLENCIFTHSIFKTFRTDQCFKIRSWIIFANQKASDTYSARSEITAAVDW